MLSLLACQSSLHRGKPGGGGDRRKVRIKCFCRIRAFEKNEVTKVAGPVGLAGEPAGEMAGRLPKEHREGGLRRWEGYMSLII